MSSGELGRFHKRCPSLSFRVKAYSLKSEISTFIIKISFQPSANVSRQYFHAYDEKTAEHWKNKLNDMLNVSHELTQNEKAKVNKNIN